MFVTRTARRLKRLIRRLSTTETTAELSQPHQRYEWSIGLYTGKSPFDLQPAAAVANPMLTHADVSDVRAEGVADPFMVKVENSWFMLFEVMNLETRKGEIAVAISANGLNWQYQQIVLREPFHLSYPYVFEWNNDIYMVPESWESHSIRLYKATDFPLRWSFVKTLLHGRDLVDPSLVYFEKKWWLFASHGKAPYRADTLCLFYADDPLSEWREHPKSPVVDRNPHIARPGGRVLVIDGTIARYAQDCFPTYGRQIRAFAVRGLTMKTYDETLISETPVISGTGLGWNANGMHHIDPHLLPNGSWLACVDGYRSIPC